MHFILSEFSANIAFLLSFHEVTNIGLKWLAKGLMIVSWSSTPAAQKYYVKIEDKKFIKDDYKEDKV